jgi:hypothetical protein
MPFFYPVSYYGSQKVDHWEQALWREVFTWRNGKKCPWNLFWGWGGSAFIPFYVHANNKVSPRLRIKQDNKHKESRNKQGNKQSPMITVSRAYQDDQDIWAYFPVLVLSQIPALAYFIQCPGPMSNSCQLSRSDPKSSPQYTFFIKHILLLILIF